MCMCVCVCLHTEHEHKALVVESNRDRPLKFALFSHWFMMLCVLVHVQVWDRGGTYLRSFGRKTPRLETGQTGKTVFHFDTQELRKSRMGGMAIDSAGNVVVADIYACLVCVFQPDGTEITAFDVDVAVDGGSEAKSDKTAQTSETQAKPSPHCVAVDLNDRIFVGSSDCCIRVFAFV